MKTEPEWRVLLYSEEAARKLMTPPPPPTDDCAGWVCTKCRRGGNDTSKVAAQQAHDALTPPCGYSVLCLAEPTQTEPMTH